MKKNQDYECDTFLWKNVSSVISVALLISKIFMEKLKKWENEILIILLIALISYQFLID